MTRTPRPARPLPAAIPDGLFVGWMVVTFFSFIVVALYHRYLYWEAGVRYVDLLGAIAGLALFLAVLAAAGLAYRAGARISTVVALAGGAVLLAVVLALLPPLVAGLGWVAVVLSVLVSLVAYAVLASWVVGAAVYMDLPWESGEDGTRTREGTDPNPISSRAP